MSTRTLASELNIYALCPIEDVDPGFAPSPFVPMRSCFGRINEQPIRSVFECDEQPDRSQKRKIKIAERDRKKIDTVRGRDGAAGERRIN